MQPQEGTAAASSYHPAAFKLQALLTLANETEREVARKLGLNLTDYRALSALAQSGPVTAGKLAEELGATPATTTAIVNRLESSGYAARQRSAEDRRQVQVSVTPAAFQGIMNQMLPLVAAISEHLKALPASEQAVVADFLDHAMHLMQDHLHTLSEKDAR